IKIHPRIQLPEPGMSSQRKRKSWEPRKKRVADINRILNVSLMETAGEKRFLFEPAYFGSGPLRKAAPSRRLLVEVFDQPSPWVLSRRRHRESSRALTLARRRSGVRTRPDGLTSNRP